MNTMSTSRSLRYADCSRRQRDRSLREQAAMHRRLRREYYCCLKGPLVTPCYHSSWRTCIKKGINCKVYSCKAPNGSMAHIWPAGTPARERRLRSSRERKEYSLLTGKNVNYLAPQSTLSLQMSLCRIGTSCILGHLCMSLVVRVCICPLKNHNDNHQEYIFKGEVTSNSRQKRCSIDNCRHFRGLYSKMAVFWYRNIKRPCDDLAIISLESTSLHLRNIKNIVDVGPRPSKRAINVMDRRENHETNGKISYEQILCLKQCSFINHDLTTFSEYYLPIGKKEYFELNTCFGSIICTKLRMRTRMLLNLEKFFNEETVIKENDIKKETESDNEEKVNDNMVSEENSIDQAEERELFANMKMKLIAKLMLQHVQATHHVKMDFNDSVDWEKLAKTNVMDRMYLVLLNEALIQPETIKAGSYAVVESSTGTKSAHLSVQEGRIHLHGLENTEPPENSYTIPMLPLQTFVNPDQPEVFMDLCAGGRWLGRVYIRLIGKSRHAQQFLALCLGVLGATYRGARFAEVGFRGMPGECVVCEEYVTENGISNKGILDGLINEGEDIRRQGMVFKSTWDGADFLICTRDLRNQSFRCPIGEVVSGLSVIREAARGHGPIREVIITAVGAVLEGNFSGAQPIHFIPQANVREISLPTNNSGHRDGSQGNQSMDLNHQDMDLGNKSYDLGSQYDELAIESEDSEDIKPVLKIKNEKDNFYH
ncbi:unnamed protein product, partial [Meganyctiphanes norvegica]